jgi:hypothetical protein
MTGCAPGNEQCVCLSFEGSVQRNDTWIAQNRERTQHFRAVLRRMLNIEDSLAERGEFELLVPIFEQSN